MGKIENQQDFFQMLSQERAILSFFIDWSLYSSKYGRTFVNEAERFFTGESQNTFSFWLVDVSWDSVITNFVFDWLKTFDDTGQKLSIWIGTGNPSILWLKSGHIIDYEFSAYLLKTDGIIKKTSKVFEI